MFKGFESISWCIKKSAKNRFTIINFNSFTIEYFGLRYFLKPRKQSEELLRHYAVLIE